MSHHDITIFIHEAHRVNLVWECNFSYHLLISQVLNVVGRPNFHETALTARNY
jgi:hypothetical protein